MKDYQYLKHSFNAEAVAAQSLDEFKAQFGKPQFRLSDQELTDIHAACTALVTPPEVAAEVIPEAIPEAIPVTETAPPAPKGKKGQQGQDTEVK